MHEEFLWCEKYRPKTVEDCILPESMKSVFQGYVNAGNLPNLLLSGHSGVGKTTIAKAMCAELGADVRVINGSNERNIDTLRNVIEGFASSVSLMGGRKYIIIDEADYLNPQSTQPALRNLMEEYSDNCGFIFTCNFKEKILKPLHSRCSVVEFKTPKSERPAMCKQFHTRLCAILTAEGIEYDSKIVGKVIMKYFPDWRACLNDVQRYAVNGIIDAGILGQGEEADIVQLIDLMKSSNFTAMRKGVAANSDSDPVVMMRLLYDQSSECLDKGSIPSLVILIADYQHKHAFAADPELNFLAFLAMVSAECSFN